jgi:hypothetical protein
MKTTGTLNQKTQPSKSHKVVKILVLLMVVLGGLALLGYYLVYLPYQIKQWDTKNLTIYQQQSQTVQSDLHTLTGDALLGSSDAQIRADCGNTVDDLVMLEVIQPYPVKSTQTKLRHAEKELNTAISANCVALAQLQPQAGSELSTGVSDLNAVGSLINNR